MVNNLTLMHIVFLKEITLDHPEQHKDMARNIPRPLPSISVKILYFSQIFDS
jgi:hypothetical protein